MIQAERARAAVMETMRGLLAESMALQREAQMCNAAGNPEDTDELLDLVGVLTSAFDACCKKLDKAAPKRPHTGTP